MPCLQPILSCYSRSRWVHKSGHFIHSFFARALICARNFLPETHSDEMKYTIVTRWCSYLHSHLHYFLSLTSLKFTSFLFLSSYKAVVNCLRACSISYFQLYLCPGDTLLGDKQGSWQKDEPTHDSTNLLKAEKIPVAKNIKAFSTLSKLSLRFHFGSFVAFGFGFQKHVLSKRDRPHEQPIAAPGMRWFSLVDATLTCRSRKVREMF